ncbi:hypothetical protein C9975_06315 [Thalassospira xiamenensis]|nr:hypothetical protein C9975_06315 [Thalassospira xiamenensis]
MSEASNQITIKQAASIAGVSQRTIHRWLRQGLLSSTMMNHRRLIEGSSLKALTNKAERPVYKASSEDWNTLLYIVKNLIELQPVSGMKAILQRQKLRDELNDLLNKAGINEL